MQPARQLPAAAPLPVGPMPCCAQSLARLCRCRMTVWVPDAAGAGTAAAEHERACAWRRRPAVVGRCALEEPWATNCTMFSAFRVGIGAETWPRQLNAKWQRGARGSRERSKLRDLIHAQCALGCMISQRACGIDLCPPRSAHLPGMRTGRGNARVSNTKHLRLHDY